MKRTTGAADPPSSCLLPSTLFHYRAPFLSMGHLPLGSCFSSRGQNVAGRSNMLRGGRHGWGNRHEEARPVAERQPQAREGQAGAEG